MARVRGSEHTRRDAVSRRVDAFGDRHSLVAFLYAVIRRFNEDGCRQDAALVAFYSFFALVPLMLVTLNVLGFLLPDNVELQARILDSGLAQFPIIGDQLRGDLGSLDRAGLGILVGVVLIGIGARGLSLALQRAADSVWPRSPGTSDGPIAVLRRTRPGALLVVAGGGLLATSILIGFVVTGLGLRVPMQVAGVALCLLLNVGLLSGAFGIATDGRFSSAELAPAAIPAALVWTGLQVIGALLMAHQVSGATEVDGFFAIVIGLVVWLYVGALATVFAMQAQAVRLDRRGSQPVRAGAMASGDR